uniref:Uncharacterized protein n=1 Tax=Quercus lobata TaxID=97700 RepID=A0A7N2LSI5_QUELO
MTSEKESSRSHAEPTPPPHRCSRRALCFLLWGCAVLCLPKPPLHHTPELTATEFAGAVHGAWKQTGAAVSHDPKLCLGILELEFKGSGYC